MIRNVFNSCNYYICGPGYIETNLTLCIGNNYSNQFPLNGLIDFVAIRDEISSEFISLNQLVNIYTGKDDFNRLSSITNSLTSYQIEYSYFKTRINQETHTNHDTFEYSYDDFGRVTVILKNSGPHKTYSFDEFGRLINDGNNTYSYDSNGNRLSKNSNIYNYDEAIKDRLNSVSNANNETIYSLTYSNNPLYPSSITKNGTTNSLSWVGDMLTAYGGYSYSYDSYGRRIKKTYTTQIPPRRIIDIDYRYENNKLVFLEKNNLLNKLTIFFIYNELNQLVAASCNSQIYFYIHDILNNIIGITDSNGNYIAKFDYDGFGNITEDIITTNSTYLSFLNLQPFRYKDYIYDEETGLFMMGHRFYDPEIGRFISPDDVDYLDPTSIGGLNLYAYCNNDPVNYYDPSGHIAISIGLLIAGFVVGALVGAGSSIITQGLTDGFENINGWQVLLDGTIGGISGLLAFSGVGALGSAAISGGLGFIGSVGGDLIRSNGDWNGVNWGKAAVMTGMNFLLGWGPGVQNSKAIGKSLGSALSGNKGLNAILKVMGNPNASSKGIQGVINLYGKTLSNGIYNALPGIMMRRIDDAFAVMLSTYISSILFDFGADYFGFWE